jgi:hypothetical protein
MQVVDEQKEARKADVARLVLAGKSFVNDEEDVFEGLSPQVWNYVFPNNSQWERRRDKKKMPQCVGLWCPTH